MDVSVFLSVSMLDDYLIIRTREMFVKMYNESTYIS